MLKNYLFPEPLHSIDSEMTSTKLQFLYENSMFVSGKVIRLNYEKKCCEVDLGGEITGIMPFENSTIYPIYHPNGMVSPNLYKLAEKIVCAKIIHLDSNYVLLSRKKNMLEALDLLKNKSQIEYACITGFSNLSAFVDIGAGITGRIYGKNFSSVMFHSIQELGFKTGDIITVKILEFLEEEKHFELSRIDTFPPAEQVFRKGEIVMCRVFDSIKDGLGHYVLINSRYCGIMDSPCFELHYGQEVLGRIRKLTPKGIHLDFLRTLQ